MKILYVKNNSERAKKFQLKTIIYEENGEKFVKKQAICEEAIPHLKNMKKSYQKLSDSIIDSRIQLAKIIDESEDSLTFEFIDGISLEQKYSEAKKYSPTHAQKVIDDYSKLINTGFKTTTFDSETMLTDEHKKLFGVCDYSVFDGMKCFSGISNIDLIFSNIIYKDDTIYLIDYEWVFELNICVDYAAYRSLHTDHDTWYDLEEHFLDEYVVGEEGFHRVQGNYLHNKPNLDNLNIHIKELQSHVEGKEQHIQELSKRLHALGEDLSYARLVVSLRDKQIEFLNNDILNATLKSKLKNIIPQVILQKLGFQKNVSKNTNPFPTKIEPNYKPFIYTYIEPELTNTITEAINNFNKKPLISIIMPVYNVDPKWLQLAIKSIEDQWYTNWELCIADDKSTNKKTIDYLKSLDNNKIKIIYLEANLNISGASNAALSLAQGKYIALMDNDDEITPDALYEMAKVINEKDAEFIYSDEDFLTIEGECTNPHYKPDFSPDLLLSHNYITHFTCFKKELLDKVGVFNKDFDGAQDYDLFLRLTEETSKVHHIQKVLYHWRMLETSTSANSDAKPEAIERGRVMLNTTLKRRGIEGKVVHGNMHHYFRVQYTIKNNPLVSIIIPFKDKPELLDMCINSILDNSSYQNYEIIAISNNSSEKETFDMMDLLEKKDTRVSFYEYNTPFNYSDINNHAVNTYANGEHILLLNNDIEIISPSWIEAMLEHSQRDTIGCVGAKLYYPNETIQHAGIIIGLGGYAGHSHKKYPRDNPGYFNRLNAVQNLSAVTAACLMVKKSIYTQMQGLDAKNFKVAYNDVDFCLRVQKEGYLNIYTPYSEMYHHESISRGYEETPDKIARFQVEKDALTKRHSSILNLGDPYYNPNLTQDREDFSLCKK